MEEGKLETLLYEWGIERVFDEYKTEDIEYALKMLDNALREETKLYAFLTNGDNRYFLDSKAKKIILRDCVHRIEKYKMDKKYLQKTLSRFRKGGGKYAQTEIKERKNEKGGGKYV